jgi:hypothetical protein
MKPEDARRLRELSAKEEALAATTVRCSKRVIKEIEAFCAQNQDIRRAVVLRDCLERGWASYQEGDDSDSP